MEEKTLYTFLNKLSMKQLFTILTLILCAFFSATEAQAQESYRALNLGLGAGGHSGYSRYASRAIPALNVNYEFDVARNFTLAPFVSLYTYSDSYYWSNDNYTYSETVIPVGVKGSYYFDELLDAHSDWDFYAAGSLGFAIVSSRWETGYDGDKHHFNRGTSLFLDLHIGAQYNFSRKMGVYLDLSSGISTIGIALHQSR
jgi:hypothetical protein